ncbi:hypothetical protein HPB48_013374 [Haemaphysalis longicornis]|uniref:Uncharacterized protein n=1 Tax=Haemaphysalis longicornis TaxID=44386 RepID=A0A9J6FHL0_HAELO|nr:hypothetical protein HPB48_013374 [Haemaphysalis longicornis]
MEGTWPGIELRSELLAYRFPRYTPENLGTKVPRIGAPSTTLLLEFLRFESKTTISASEAMRHSYFGSLGPNIHKLPDTASTFTIPSVQLSRAAS